MRGLRLGDWIARSVLSQGAGFQAALTQAVFMFNVEVSQVNPSLPSGDRD